MTTPDPKTVREIAREHILDCGQNADDIGAYVTGRVGPDLTKHEYGAWCSAVRGAIRTATIAVSWPGEQPLCSARHAGGHRCLLEPGHDGTHAVRTDNGMIEWEDEQAPADRGDYLGRLEHHLGAYCEDDDAEFIDNPVAYRWLTVGDQRAAVAELKQLRAEREGWFNGASQRLRHAYRSGWDDRGEAVVAALGSVGGFMEAEKRAAAYAVEWWGTPGIWPLPAESTGSAS